jgi:hypothetical protein
MLPKVVEHYLSEITQMLRGGGRRLINWLALNEEFPGMIEKKVLWISGKSVDVPERQPVRRVDLR